MVNLSSTIMRDFGLQVGEYKMNLPHLPAFLGGLGDESKNSDSDFYIVFVRALQAIFLEYTVI